jgi:hypothetical protein
MVGSYGKEERIAGEGGRRAEEEDETVYCGKREATREMDFGNIRESPANFFFFEGKSPAMWAETFGAAHLRANE